MKNKAVQFFVENEIISASKLPKERRRFTYYDMIAFAALFAKEQQTKSLQEFNNYLSDLYTDRDSYSSGKLLDLVKDRAEELFSDSEALPLHDVSNNEVAVCHECKEPHSTDTKTTEQICLNCGNGWQTDC